MRAFIFIKKQKKGNKEINVIVGMVQSDTYPSTHVAPGGEFFGCQCHEVKERCHVEID